MGKEVIRDPNSAQPIGPYSQGIKAGNFIFVAGEKGIDPSSGKVIEGGIEAETRQTFENIKGILESAGASLDDVVASSVFMTNLKEFDQMNGIYAKYLNNNPPGRTTVEVSALPAGAHIEITVTAYIE